MQATATLELVASDLLAGVKVRPWATYLNAAREAFDRSRELRIEPAATHQ